MVARKILRWVSGVDGRRGKKILILIEFMGVSDLSSTVMKVINVRKYKVRSSEAK